MMLRSAARRLAPMMSRPMSTAPPPSSGGGGAVAGVAVLAVGAAGGYYYYNNLYESAPQPAASTPSPSPGEARKVREAADVAAEEEAKKAAAARAKMEAERSALAGLLKAAEGVAREEGKAAEARELARLKAEAAVATNARSVSERAKETTAQKAIDEAETLTAGTAKQVADSAIRSVSGSRPERVTVGKDAPVDPRDRLDKMARESAVKAKTISQAATAEEMAALLKEDLDASFEGDVSAMSPTELRERIHRLSSELRDRGKWEALRLNEFLKKNEEMWKSKFVEFAEFQHEALKQEVKDTVKMLEEKAEAANNEWRRNELQRLHSQLQADAQTELDKFMTRVNKSSADKVEQRLAALAALRGRVEGIMAHMKNRVSYEQAAHRVHKINAATLALVEATLVKRDATEAVEALRVASEGDDLIQTTLAALPGSIFRSGVTTRKQLDSRFPRVVKEGRAASMVPESGGLIGQAIGSVTAALFLNSGRSETTEEEGPAAQVAAVNKVFDSAENAVARGDLRTAVAELRRLRGFPATAVKDWVDAAAERLTLEQNIKAIRAHTATLTASMY